MRFVLNGIRTIGLIGAGNVGGQIARLAVARGYDVFGFDTVDAGPLSEGRRFQRDTPAYGPRRTAHALRRDLAAASRTLQS